MVEKIDFNEFQISWQLFSMTLYRGFASDGLKRLWNYKLGEGDYSCWDFFHTFKSYSLGQHMVKALELRPMADPRKKTFLKLCIFDAMDDKALHDVIYGAPPVPFKAQMVAWLKETCEKRIQYWENIEETIGESLNVKDDPWTGEDHPLGDVLDEREEIGWVLLGIRDQQAEDKYVTVDIKSYERRMKIADITLKKLVLFSLWDYYPEYHEPTPYAPSDFWWRRIDGHEFQLPKEDWVRGWLDYDKALQEVKKIEEEEKLANLNEAAALK